MARQKRDPDDQGWPLSSASIAAAIRIWGGSFGELARLLEARGLKYSRASIGFLASGEVRTAPREVLEAIAEITLGYDLDEFFQDWPPAAVAKLGAPIAQVISSAYQRRIGRRLSELNLPTGYLLYYIRILARWPWLASRMVLGGGEGSFDATEKLLAAIVAAVEHVDTTDPKPFSKVWFDRRMAALGASQQWLEDFRMSRDPEQTGTFLAAIDDQVFGGRPQPKPEKPVPAKSKAPKSKAKPAKPTAKRKPTK